MRTTTGLGAAFFLVALGAFAACGGPDGHHTTPLQPRGEVTLRVLSIGDFHGNLEAHGDVGGAAWLAAHLKERARGVDGALLVGAGDILGASPLPSAVQHDEPTLDIMGRMGLAASAVGNHELDEGYDELVRLESGGCHDGDPCDHPWPGASFPFLAANVALDDGSPAFLPGAIVDVAGAHVGLVGASWRKTPTVTVATAVEGLTFDDEAVAVRREAGVLREEGADVVIALTHVPGAPLFGCSLGGDIVPFTSAVADVVDVVLSGHSHARFACPIDDVPTIAAGAFGDVFGEVDLTVDLDARTVTAGAPLTRDVDHDIAPDAGVAAAVAEAVAASVDIGAEVTGTVTADLRATPNVAGESSLGDVDADAQLAATAPAGARIAFQQNGGLRDSLLVAPTGDEQPGEVTVAELFAVHPFGNVLETVTLTGAQIERALEDQFSSQQGILQVSGLSYAWSGPDASGRHVVPGSVLVGDKPLAPAGEYRVTVNNFLVERGVFAAGRDVTTGPVDVDALIAWFRTHSPVSPPPAGRIQYRP